MKIRFYFSVFCNISILSIDNEKWKKSFTYKAGDHTTQSVVLENLTDLGPLFCSSGFKIIILDECDAMTKDAQNALRRIVEKYTDNVRWGQTSASDVTETRMGYFVCFCWIRRCLFF